MSTSIWAQQIAFSVATLTDDDPCDVATVLALANNAMHYADGAGQVRVCAHGRGTAGLNPPSVVAGSTYYSICAFGPFPVSIRSDGTSYPMRVAVAGYRDGNATTSSFRVVLSAPAVTIRDMWLAGANVGTFTTTSTSDAWVQSPKMLTMTAQQVSDAAVEQSDVGLASGAAEVALVELHVYASTDVANYPPTLTGIYAAEYVGL